MVLNQPYVNFRYMVVMQQLLGTPKFHIQRLRNFYGDID